MIYLELTAFNSFVTNKFCLIDYAASFNSTVDGKITCSETVFTTLYSWLIAA